MLLNNTWGAIGQNWTQTFIHKWCQTLKRTGCSQTDKTQRASLKFKAINMHQ